MASTVVIFKSLSRTVASGIFVLAARVGRRLILHAILAVQPASDCRRNDCNRRGSHGQGDEIAERVERTSVGHRGDTIASPPETGIPRRRNRCKNALPPNAPTDVTS